MPLHNKGAQAQDTALEDTAKHPAAAQAMDQEEHTSMLAMDTEQDTAQEATERQRRRRDHIHPDMGNRSLPTHLAVARYQAHLVGGKRGRGIKLRKLCRIRDLKTTYVVHIPTVQAPRVQRAHRQQVAYAEDIL